MKGWLAVQEANKLQVGGTHYKTSYEHWDWIIDNSEVGPTYLIATATKYVARWRKKNGLQDLQKALHYVNKLIENRHRVRYRTLYGEQLKLISAETERFIEANNLTDQEADFCEKLMLLRSEDDLYSARDIIVALMEQVDQAQ